MKIIYSFLFELVDDFQNGLIPKKTFVDILLNTYAYLKITKQNNGKIDFTNLSKNISKMLTNKYKQGN